MRLLAAMGIMVALSGAALADCQDPTGNGNTYPVNTARQNGWLKFTLPDGSTQFEPGSGVNTYVCTTTIVNGKAKDIWVQQ